MPAIINGADRRPRLRHGAGGPGRGRTRRCGTTRRRRPSAAPSTSSRDRRRGRRRRRRHQLLDLGSTPTSSTRSRSRSSTPPRPGCSSPPRPATARRPRRHASTHNSPWDTTVAASTHDRGATKTVTLGNGATVHRRRHRRRRCPATADRSMPPAWPAAGPGAQAELCFAGTPRPGQGDRQDRAVPARRQRPRRQEQGGPAGRRRRHDPVQHRRRDALNADFHFVPTVHVDQPRGAAIKAYIAAHGRTRPRRSAVRHRSGARARRWRVLRRSGPALAGGGDLLKPDITAPGVDVLAARRAGRASGGNAVGLRCRAPRCRARTSRASPRCCAARTRRGRRWRSSRR